MTVSENHNARAVRQLPTTSTDADYTALRLRKRVRHYGGINRPIYLTLYTLPTTDQWRLGYTLFQIDEYPHESKIFLYKVVVTDDCGVPSHEYIGPSDLASVYGPGTLFAAAVTSHLITLGLEDLI